MHVTCNRTSWRTLNICSKHEMLYWIKRIKIKVCCKLFWWNYVPWNNPVGWSDSGLSEHNMRPCKCRITVWALHAAILYRKFQNGGKIGKFWKAPSWFRQVFLVTKGPFGVEALYCVIGRFDFCCSHHSLSCKECHRAADPLCSDGICHIQKPRPFGAQNKSRWLCWHTGLTQFLSPANPRMPGVKEGKLHELSSPINLLWWETVFQIRESLFLGDHVEYIKEKFEPHFLGFS